MKKIFVAIFLLIANTATAGPIVASAGKDYLFDFEYNPLGLTIASNAFFTGIDFSTVDRSEDAGRWFVYPELNAGGVGGGGRHNPKFSQWHFRY